MVLEVALIDVTPGQEDAFAAAYAQGHDVLAGTPGCRSVLMTRGIETPNRFVLLVEWDSVEAHERNFRQTDRFTAGEKRSCHGVVDDDHRTRGQLISLVDGAPV